ncbi:hypothetical protein MNEG_9699 [Monoraphidium neglectum]|uniref:AP2/ERF domain-containing protein n=1 Tax=Monoraphidium neglectum TaxID=145388 RepID=A0A0D2JFM3_9CHLO|nr:hypothetical protein MNEG_9699 [Monoraphidium neglectum]KIY98262.1 hypothetical protein MNEG_9699 [Monoraphidium neglectum]|eukprot:XP_013897282.1 hypothetical protein MNEG_9699 [Monoraphidium neglectum]
MEDELSDAERERLKRQYRGVFWDKKTRRWRCQLGFQSKKIFLGYFDTAQDAAKAYDRKLVELRGASARTNYPITEYLSLLGTGVAPPQQRAPGMLGDGFGGAAHFGDAGGGADAAAQLGGASAFGDQLNLQDLVNVGSGGGGTPSQLQLQQQLLSLSGAGSGGGAAGGAGASGGGGAADQAQLLLRQLDDTAR